MEPQKGFYSKYTPTYKYNFDHNIPMNYNKSFFRPKEIVLKKGSNKKGSKTTNQKNKSENIVKTRGTKFFNKANSTNFIIKKMVNFGGAKKNRNLHKNYKKKKAKKRSGLKSNKIKSKF